MPIAAAVVGIGFMLNGCGGSDSGAGGGGGGGSGPGTTGTGGGSTSAGTPTSSGTSSGTNSTSSGANSTSSGANSTSSGTDPTSGAGAGPASGTGVGGSGTIECDEPGGTVPPLRLTEVARGLNQPLFVTSEPEDPSRLYVVQQGGTIRLINGGELQSAPFLDITADVQGSEYDEDERGLLGLAFHPQYASNGRFFVYYNTRSRTLVLREYKRSASNPDRADPQATELFSIPVLRGNHNGGMLAFGPDGMLYIGVGDGGGDTSDPDPNNNGQNIEVKYAKILRVDVENHPTAPAGNVRGGDPYVWDYGLRNPWRFSFDRCRGDLYIGDVGGRLFEEINIEPRGQGNKNYGWSVTEGGTCLKDDEATSCDSPTITRPVVAYDHDSGDGSVTGGYVYRGSRIPALRGKYLFGDFETDRVWMLTWKDGVATPRSSLSQDLASESTIQGLASFGEDAAGELYIVSYGGSIFRIDPE
ncbi:PQQ-dependent sugar dehydrogenase [Sorangium atrum]|uniref:PQQ-dependent sugar dehydrogenase n=1 Tax=Sorangium atrum TaxID=2995308 RepID=A0ABT5C9N9_9BACT|nr:PQQ-dependent sugar dehydrogenase [Sorangium aterium]MDC0682328.1 PQQ-dependent sugar dehydrogenase [Sorangium aterium]